MDLNSQLHMLMTTGECDLPLTWVEVAGLVAKHPDFAYALKRAHDGQPKLLNLITEACAARLCKDFGGVL